jgi:hypothetical protein
MLGQEDDGPQAPVLVDTLGLLMSVAVHPANVQDRDGVILVLKPAWRLFAFGYYHAGRPRLVHDGRTPIEGHEACTITPLAA